MKNIPNGVRPGAISMIGARRSAGPAGGKLLLLLACLGLGVPASGLGAQARFVDARDTTNRGRSRRSEPVEAEVPISRSAGPVTHVSMAAQLSDNLALLFEKFGESEFVLCIEGELVGTSELELRDFRMPHVSHSDRNGVGIHPGGGCSQYADIIGTIHNHPPRYPEDRGREWNNCYLSRGDISSWLDNTQYPFTLVMCGPRLWAWWHRAQVDATRTLAFPPSGQLEGRDQLAGSGR